MAAYSSERAFWKELNENDDGLDALSDGQRCETHDADPATTTVQGGGDVFDVLYVEDSRSSLRLVSEAFAETEAPVRLDGVQTGTAAVAVLADDRDRASTARPDLVLLDLDLGDMSGFDVLERMHDRSALGSMPVVVFADSRARADIERASEYGATAYVQKPPDFETLVAIARRAVDSWHSGPTAVEADQ